MKRFIALTVVLTAAVGLTISVFAGPMPMAEKNVAPIAPSCDWTGLYIGINAGVGQLDSSFTDRSDWEDTWSGARKFSETAFVGGGQIGYNHQWQDLVFGIEADFSGSTADIKRSSLQGEGLEETAEGNEGYTEGFTDHAKIDYMGTIRARLGISLLDNRALLYVTAGGAFAHGSWDSYYRIDLPSESYFYSADWKGDDWRWGWVGGFGLEYAFNCHWSLRGEGLYYWFADNTTPITGSSSPGSYFTYYRYTFSDTFWTYRVGLNYKFTGFFGAH